MHIPPLSVAVAFSFSVLTGIVFGYYPAKSASEMNPIDALRHE
jgi:putative ABC transport system permease protein